MTAVLIPRATVTADNYGPAVSVITWILMVSAVLGVLLKVGLGVNARVPIGSDDATLIFATVKIPQPNNISSLMPKPKWYQVLSIAQSIAVSIQISNGIGRHRDSLTVAQIERFEKVSQAQIENYLNDWLRNHIGWICCKFAVHRQFGNLKGFGSCVAPTNHPYD